LSRRSCAKADDPGLRTDFEIYDRRHHPDVSGLQLKIEAAGVTAAGYSRAGLTAIALWAGSMIPALTDFEIHDRRHHPDVSGLQLKIQAAGVTAAAYRDACRAKSAFLGSYEIFRGIFLDKIVVPD
jgi:hypothetical protein